MNPKNCKITNIHDPIQVKHGLIFKLHCRYCHFQVTPEGVLVQKEKKMFDRDKVYKSTLQFYISKGYTKDHANAIAQKIVEEQMARFNS